MRPTGFEFSKQDFDTFLNDDMLWDRNPDGPVMVVVTVCRLSRVHDTEGRPIRNNVRRFDLGEFRFWINVVVGFKDRKARRHTGNTRSPVWLDLNLRFFHLSGDRMS